MAIHHSDALKTLEKKKNKKIVPTFVVKSMVIIDEATTNLNLLKYLK